MLKMRCGKEESAEGTHYRDAVGWGAPCVLPAYLSANGDANEGRRVERDIRDGWQG